MGNDILIGIPKPGTNSPKFILETPNTFETAISVLREVSASINVELTPAFINILKDAGMIEELTTNNMDGSYTHELLPIDEDWPRVIDN